MTKVRGLRPRVRGADVAGRLRCRRALPSIPILILLLAAATRTAPAAGTGTHDDPIVDSDMTREEAVLRGVSPKAPAAVLERQAVVDVRYRGFDGRIHRGQIVVDRSLVGEVREAFRKALRAGFPIHSVIPVSHPRFRWSDERSMAANNTSGFNYRRVTGGERLSRHALGTAVDVNPIQNPYIRGGTVLPPGARYDPHRPGTLTEEGPVVRAFLRFGWTWGGHWKTLKDYQHFQAPPRTGGGSGRTE